MKISKEVKTGILVISGIILFIFGFNYLKGNNLLDSSKTFYAEFDNVEGLASSSIVTINGLTVGKVPSISFKKDGSGKLIVTLLVDNDFEFSKNSTAQLYDLGFIGGKAIAIIPAFDGAENAKNNAFLKSSVKKGFVDLVGNKLTPLQERLEKMLISADVLLNNMNDVFDDETKINLKKSIAELSTTMNSFKQTSQSLNHVIVSNQKHLDSVIINANAITGNLSEVTKSLAESDLDQIMKNLESTLKSLDGVMHGLENGQGSMGKLLKDDALYNNLEASTAELEALLNDIKLHPKRYFRILSKKEIPYQEVVEVNN